MVAPLLTNVKPADARNYMVAKKASLWFRKAGSSSEADWLDLGNIIDPTMSVDPQYLDHFTNRRSGRTKDRQELILQQAAMKFQVDEMATEIIQKIFGSSAAKSTSTIKVRYSQIFTNPGNAGTIDLKTLNINTGADLVLRETKQEGTPATYVVTTDYTVVAATGIITITAGALANPVTVPEVHIYWNKTINTDKFQIFDGTPIKGEAQFQILGDSGPRMVYRLPNVVLKNDGDIAFGDGSDWIKVGLQLEILADASGSMGDAHVVNAVETT